jgi:hypothetical protein
MQTYWTISHGITNYHIDLKRQEGEVLMTEDTGHWKSENGGAVSYERFLEGRFHNLILEHFDAEILREVIASVEELVGG